MEGWVKAHRSILDHWIWKDKPFARGQAWMDLVFLANHDSEKTFINGELIEVQRGQHITSILKLSDRWGWGRKKVSKFLDDLENDKMLNQKRTTQYTAITLTNYEVYQSKEHRVEQRKNIGGTAEEQPRNTNKNEKNEKNEKKGTNTTVRFTPPEIETIREYCSGRNNSVDPQTFYDFYASKGWMIGKNKMKDWKAAVRTWERGSNGQTRQGVTAKRDPISEVDSWV